MWLEVKVTLGMLEKVSSTVLGGIEIVGMLTTHGQENELLEE